MSNCGKCIYYGKRTETCDFYLITGVRRGCGIEDCRHYERLKGKKRPPPPVVTPAKPKEPRRVRTFANGEEMMELYKRGMNDNEIAQEIGCSSRNVTYWRSRVGLPPQGKRGRKKKEERNAGNGRI